MLWFAFQAVAFIIWVGFASLLAIPIFWYIFFRDLLLPARLRWPSAKASVASSSAHRDPLSQPLVARGRDGGETDEEQPGMSGAGMKEVCDAVLLLDMPVGLSPEGKTVLHPQIGSKLGDTAPTNVARLGAMGTLKKIFTISPPQCHSHLGGLPRRVVLSTVGAFSMLLASILNRMHVKNKDRLVELIRNRPPGTPLITISNHMSTLDDPLMWGIFGAYTSEPHVCRWTLTAEDICFTNPVFSYFFHLGKCIPVKRGGGINQPTMMEAVKTVNEGEWLHTFPEGRVVQERAPIQRLKWGTGSIIAKASVPPLIVPIGHSGFETVMPEMTWYGRRTVIPLAFQNIVMVVGEPFQFDVPALRRAAEQAMARGEHAPSGEDSPGRNRSSSAAVGGDVDGEGSFMPGPKAAEAAEGPQPGQSSRSSRDMDEAVRRQSMGFLPNVTVVSEPADKLPPDPHYVPTEAALRRSKAESKLSPEEAAKVKAKKIDEVGDEVTRLLYSHLTEHMRRRLNDVVMEAHALNKPAR